MKSDGKTTIEAGKNISFHLSSILLYLKKKRKPLELSSFVPAVRPAVLPAGRCSVYPGLILLSDSSDILWPLKRPVSYEKGDDSTALSETLLIIIIPKKSIKVDKLGVWIIAD